MSDTFDRPQREDEPAPAAASQPQSEPTAVKQSSINSGLVFLLILFGVFLPGLTLVIELVTHMCAESVMDPIPTPWHVGLIAAVAVGNYLVIDGLRTKNHKHWRQLQLINGLVLAVAAVYAVRFAPITPVAFVGIVWIGIGFLPLSPLFSLLSALVLSIYLRNNAPVKTTSQPILIGVAIGLGLLLMAEFPQTITKMGMKKAASQDISESRAGILMLRAFGDDDVLLKECYPHPDPPTALLDTWLRIYDSDTQQKARRIYYRTTGRPFNLMPKPFLHKVWTDFRGDSETGGEEVGGRSEMLHLSQSQLDASINQEANLASSQWTMVFTNNAERDAEARTQIQLPPNAVVSGLTLWINGSPHQAVFGPRNVVRSAYQSVTWRQRDPVLVTTCGPDRVMMQCFPVPKAGGTMKVRLNITTPLILNDKHQAQMLLPQLVENNFTVDQQPVIRATTTSAGTKISLSLPEIGTNTEARRLPVYSVPQTTAGHVFAQDDKIRSQVITQTISTRPTQAPSLVVIVVDGSASMQKHMKPIAEALVKFPHHIKARVVFAADALSSLSPQTPSANLSTLDESMRALPNAPCEGGPDNTEALYRACSFVKDTTNSAVIWIHGPQPVLSDNGWNLQYRFEQLLHQQKIPVLELQTESGPNRVDETLASVLQFQLLPRIAGVQNDLEALFDSWRPGHTETFVVREAILPSQLTACAQTTGELTQLWANEETKRLVASNEAEKGAALASSYRVVTPVSGAVVLPTRLDYEKNGLNPENPDLNANVPSAPEPEFWLLSMIAMTALFWQIRRSRRLGARA